MMSHVAAKRGAGTTDARSGIVYALEHRFHGVWWTHHYKTHPRSASQLPAPLFADTVGHYFKKMWVAREKLKIWPKFLPGDHKGKQRKLPSGDRELFRMAPRGHVQTLTQRTWERRRASCRCVRQGKCRSMKMRVLETEQTSSPHENFTAYIQPQGGNF